MLKSWLSSINKSLMVCGLSGFKQMVRFSVHLDFILRATMLCCVSSYSLSFLNLIFNIQLQVDNIMIYSAVSHKSDRSEANNSFSIRAALTLMSTIILITGLC